MSINGVRLGFGASPAIHGISDGARKFFKRGPEYKYHLNSKILYIIFYNNISDKNSFIIGFA